MSFICPLLVHLRRFLLLSYTYTHYTAKLLLSSFMPFQVRPSISISLLLQAASCCLFFFSLPPYISCLTTLFIPLFLLHGVGYRLIRSSGTSLRPLLSYVLLHGFFSFSGFLCGKLSLR